MIKKIKAIMDVEGNLNNFGKEINKNTKSLDSMSKDISKIHENIKNLKNEFKTMSIESNKTIKQISDDMHLLKKSRELMQKELYEIKVLKSHIKEKLVKELLSDFRSEIQSNIDKIKVDAVSYNGVKSKMTNLVEEMSSIKNEFEKFIKISKHLKETDFHLVGYAKKLQIYEAEKQKLKKENEVLQRIVSQERRHKKIGKY